MLGLQESMSVGGSSSKTYSCVACASTFHNLSSLLVHQASHASEVSHQGFVSSSCASCGSIFTSQDLLEKHNCSAIPPADPTLLCPPVCVSDGCDEEKSSTALEDHKKTHQSQTQVKLHSENASAAVSAKSVHAEIQPDGKIKSRPLLSVQVFHSVSPFCSESPPVPSASSADVTDVSIDSKNNIFELYQSDSKTNEQNLCLEKKSDPLTCSSANRSEDFSVNPPDPTTESNINPKSVPAPDLKNNVFELSHSNSKNEEQSLCLNTKSEPVTCSSPNRSEDFSVNPPDPTTESNMNPKPVPAPDLKNNVFELSQSDSKTEEHNLCLEMKSEPLTCSSPNRSEDFSVKPPDPTTESNTNPNSVLKIVASAYMNHNNPEIKLRTLPPRKVSPRAPPQVLTSVPTSHSRPPKIYSEEKSALLKMLTRRVISKKKKKKRIISVIQPFHPVVALETRQKLVGKDNSEGNHQCATCRKVFQHKDSLIMHHVLHMKHRAKFCVRCQQFVLTVAEAHNCFDKPSITSSATLQQPEKTFHCRFCNRKYLRKRGLRQHNCLGNGKPFSYFKKPTLKNSSTVVNEANQQEVRKVPVLKLRINVGVGTEPSLKIEDHNTDLPIAMKNHMPLQKTKAPSNSAQQSTTGRVSSDPRPAGIKPVPVSGSINKLPSEKESLSEKQWTMPLDDAEIDVLTDMDQQSSTAMPEKQCVEKKDASKNTEVKSLLAARENVKVPSFSKDGRQFVCTLCHRSCSRYYNLMQHMKYCMIRRQQAASRLSGPLKPFACPHCDSSFSRKDNMKLHVKKCHGSNPTPQIATNHVEREKEGVQENLFVLSPSTESQKAKPSSSQSTSSSSSNSSSNWGWGIMSLPTVLPRRVTCECGASFNCPRLLFEHLQVHAQESYICPQCGENQQSWMDFEAHQKLHRQSQSQSSEPKGQQQFSHSNSSPKPTLAATLHQPTPSFQVPKSSSTGQPAAILTQEQRLSKKTDVSVCHRCKKTFMGRKSMLRHLRMSCRGDPGIPKKPLVQTSTVRPPLKPFRCPVCVRWFSCVEGLKRHLVSHSRLPVFTCQICDCSCPSLQSLEEHKRNVHGVSNKIKTEEDKPEPATKAAAQHVTPTEFQCHICLRYYPKLQSLKDHIRKVHRPKQTRVNVLDPVHPDHFQCQICSDRFPDLISLKNHKRRVHPIMGTMFQPSKAPEQNGCASLFQCQLCGRSYPNITSLKNHRRRVHHIIGGLELFRGISQYNPFKCQICLRSYPDMVSLKNHRRRVHKILGPVPETTPTMNDSSSALHPNPVPLF